MRERLLSAVSAILTDTLDSDSGLTRLARLFAHEYCDYCVTYVLASDSDIRRVGAAHADPEGEALVKRLLELSPLSITDEHGAGRAMRTGEPILAREIPLDLLERAAQNDEHLAILRRLRPVSSMILPLRARGRTLGAISFTTTADSGRRYAEEDLRLAQELAQRIGLALDNVHLLRTAEARARALEKSERELRASEERVQVALEAGGLGTWEWHVAEDTVHWSEALERIHGLEPGSFAGTFEAFEADIHPDDRQAVLQATHRAVAGDCPEYRVEYRIVRPDGEVRWLDARGRLLRDADGHAVRMVGVCSDITAQRKEQARVRFLARAGPVLASSLDHRTTLRRLAELAVPDVADWCVVNLLEDGVIVPLAISHREPEHRDALEQRVRTEPPSLDAPIGTGAVIRTGEPLVLREVPEEVVEAAVRDEEDRRVLDQIALRSVIMVPLEARGDRFGCLTLAQSTSGRRFDDEDVTLAMELARRASIAVDNARLYERSEGDRRRAEKAARARDELLAYVSHDLRQPLNVMGVVLALLHQGDLPDDKQEEMLARGHSALKQANRMIDDLLDAARGPEGRPEMKPEEVDLGGLVAAIVDDLSMHADGTVTLEVSPEVPAVSVDVDHIRRVISNLLSNAVRHTPPGGEVSVSVTAEEGSVLLRVSDDGRGIAPEDRARVFDRYWRGANGGLGLGLAIAREIVEAHHGRIWLQSEPGEGTTFFVRLPSAAKASVRSATRA